MITILPRLVPGLLEHAQGIVGAPMAADLVQALDVVFQLGLVVGFAVALFGSMLLIQLLGVVRNWKARRDGR